MSSSLSSTQNSISNQDEVVQHSEVPNLNTLLCGAHPEIYSARVRTKRKLPDLRQNLETPSSVMDLDQNNQYEVPPGEVPKTARPEAYYKNKQFQQSLFFAQLRQDEEFYNSMTKKLTAYQDASRKKKLVHEEDYESHYSKPLQLRIKAQMSPSNYNQYLSQKHKMIQSMDLNPVPIRSTSKLPPLATIKVSTQGLKDPAVQYQIRKRKEKRLNYILDEARGELKPEKKIPPLDTLDYHHITISQQTRFYYGNDPEMGNKSGRKYFEDRGTSKIGQELTILP